MKNIMKNLEVIIKEAGIEIFKGSDLLEGKDKIANYTNFINIETKEMIELVNGYFTSEEGFCCYQVDIADDYFVNARQILLTTFSNKDLTNELFRRVSNEIVTEVTEIDELDEVILGGYQYE